MNTVCGPSRQEVGILVSRSGETVACCCEGFVDGYVDGSEFCGGLADEMEEV